VKRKGFKKWLVFIFSSILLFATALPSRFAHAKGGPQEVDLELILAVDISYSMDMEEQRLQREGYIQALTSPDVLKAIRAGMVGKIAVTYFEWAGATTQRVVVPWQVIDGPETANAFVAKLAAAPISRWYGFDAPRRVLDISGDGANNHGSPVVDARDRALKAGIVINGLPIMISNGRRSVFDMDDLDDYYTDCVIGGPGAFMIAIKERDQFVQATRVKILREIAAVPGNDTIPPGLRVIPVNSDVDDKKKINCRIGERQWEERYRN
jgi:Protein of unknown function (DUF1194)